MAQRNVSRRSALIAGTVGLAALPFAGSAAQAQEVRPYLNRKIFLDPGHGGGTPARSGTASRRKT